MTAMSEPRGGPPRRSVVAGGWRKRLHACRIVAVATILLATTVCTGQDAAPRPAPRANPGKAAVMSAAEPSAFDPRLPSLGTTFAPLPAGAGKQVADLSCQKCHSSDILRQQRLDAKKWTAVVDKMIRWGAEVSEAHKNELVNYLATDFGPDNDHFTPIVTRPVGK